MATILSCQNLSLGICEQVITARLKKYQEKTFCEIVIDVGKISIGKGAGGSD